MTGICDVETGSRKTGIFQIFNIVGQIFIDLLQVGIFFGFLVFLLEPGAYIFASPLDNVHKRVKQKNTFVSHISLV